MAPTTATTTPECPSFLTGLETLGENLRAFRETVAEGRETTREMAARAAGAITRHPLRTAAVMMTAGAVAGCMLGFATGWKKSAKRNDRTWLEFFA
jgi:hypothetical protein